jgi:hypothetical protein
MNTVKKFKWYWAWQDEQEEAWLAEMSADGLHLESIELPGQYTFRQGEPGNYVYRLDFQTMKSKDKDSYLQLFADAGWEHIGDMGGWVYFRHLVNGNEIPEIFSDRESKLGKYQRLLTYLVIFLPIMIILLPNVSDALRYGPFVGILVGLSAGLLVLYSLALLLIFRRIRQIKSKSM